MTKFNGVKVFSATMFADREILGDRITEWMRDNPRCAVTDMVVTQSSDREFHCIAITVFFYEAAPASSGLSTPRRLKFRESR